MIICPFCGFTGKLPSQSIKGQANSFGIFFRRNKLEVTCPDCGFRYTARQLLSLDEISVVQITGLIMISLIFCIIFILLFG